MRKGLLRLSLLGLALASACADNTPSSSPDATAIGGNGARIHRSDTGRLTLPSSAPATDVVRGYLHAFVEDAADQMSLVSQTTSLDGISHLRFEQVVDGLRVHGAYVKAAITASGELVQVIENLAPASGRARPASIVHRDALGAALQELGYNFATPLLRSSRGNIQRFDRASELYREPSVERVAYYDGTQLKQGFLVETWALSHNQLDETLVSGNGAILSTERRTANDSYNVFAEDPGKGAQQVLPGNNWLGAGAQTTQNITGPNAHAYLDVDANNQPDSGGTAVTDGNFLTAANLAVAPTTAGNRNVAVQNLFYLNNVAHDRLAAVGFTPSTGNFEGSDPVNAEAQDGSGTDNANFSTPSDGSSPRMQMYLWTGRAPSVIINGSIGGYQSSFGPAFTTTALSGPLARTSPADGCTANATSLAGKVALVDRGSCDFTVKVMNAQTAGAIAVVIANNTDGAPFSPGGTNRKVKIPSAMVSQADGLTLAGTATASLVKNTVTALQLDGDVDADIVFHEYGHGLTWRMIGSMSGAISGAIGEGASDVLAFLLNGDDVIGEYSYSDPLGIRRAPYGDYTLTYANVDGAEVHNDGEIYAAAMYRTLLQYRAAGLSDQELLADWVASMNLIPASPRYEDMRDGLIAQVGASSAKACHVWRAFASIGIGQGSSSAIVFKKGKNTVVTVSSSAVPAACQ